MSNEPILRYRLLCDNQFIPNYATEGAACFDIHLPDDIDVVKGVNTIDLYVAFDLDPGTTLLLYPRSSTLVKHRIIMPTSVIDSDYKDSIHAILYSTTHRTIHFNAGTRLLQGMVVNAQHVKLVEEYYFDLKGRGGLGSTGI